MMRAFALIAAALVAVAAPAGAAGLLTFANNPTGGSVLPFGPSPNTPTYSQVFASPKAGTLTSFTFSLTGGVGQISAAVGTWISPANDTSTGGSPITLWQSGFVTSEQGAITFAPGVQLSGLTRYVAYITVYDRPDATGSTALLLGDNANEAALRYFVFDNGTGNPAGNPSWDFY